MNVLMLSKSGDGLGIAFRLIQEGHAVRLFIQDAQYKWAGRGLVDRVDSWRPSLPWADFVIGDMVGFGKYESVMRGMGKPFLGVSEIADKIELDRSAGTDLFKKAGISTPPTMEFSSPTDAEDVLAMWKDPGYVLKPDGNIETSKTYVCRDKDTFEYALSTYKASQQLVVQEIVEGVEVSTEGWFNGRDWITPFNHTFEEKRFLEGGRGPQTGCQGNVVLTAGRDRLVEETLLRLTPFLRDVSYKGPFDVNCIVTEHEAFALEVTPRFGYDAIEAVIEGLREPLLDVLFETAAGIKKTIALSDDVLIAVRVSVPPWPHAEPEAADRGRPVLGVTKEAMKHLFPTDIFQEDDRWLYAAGDGVVYKATARGRDVKEARRRVYRTVDSIDILDKQYRTDIGQRVPSDVARLIKWGWLENKWGWAHE